MPCNAYTVHICTEGEHARHPCPGICVMTPLTSSDTRDLLGAAKLQAVADLVLQRCETVATTSQGRAYVSFEVPGSRRVVIARTLIGTLHCWMVMSSNGTDAGTWALDTPASLLAEAVELELDQLSRL